MFNYNSKVVQSNIDEIWDQHTHSDYQEGRKWYGEANQFSLELAEKYKVTPVVSAGVLSALSPLKEWNLNKRVADQFFQLVEKSPATGWRKVPHFFKQRKKAFDIYMLKTPFVQDVSNILRGLKTVNFFNCIQNPLSCDALCVDRHMIKVAISDDREKLTRKQYLFLQEEYLTFAKRVNMIPNQAQAILWCAYKRVKKV